MIPVNYLNLCVLKKGLQILQELDHALGRSKHMVGLIIVGTVSLIAPIASATTSALALAQEVQTAGFVC